MTRTDWVPLGAAGISAGIAVYFARRRWDEERGEYYWQIESEVLPLVGDEPDRIYENDLGESDEEAPRRLEKEGGE